MDEGIALVSGARRTRLGQVRGARWEVDLDRMPDRRHDWHCARRAWVSAISKVSKATGATPTTGRSPALRRSRCIENKRRVV